MPSHTHHYYVPDFLHAEFLCSCLTNLHFSLDSSAIMLNIPRICSIYLRVTSFIIVLKAHSGLDPRCKQDQSMTISSYNCTIISIALQPQNGCGIHGAHTLLAQYLQAPFTPEDPTYMYHTIGSLCHFLSQQSDIRRIYSLSKMQL